MKVKKRDNTVVVFNQEKIKDALIKAFTNTQEKYSDDVLNNVVGKINELNKEVLDVEEIQDIVEKELCNYSVNTAVAYIKYRTNHEAMRNINKIVKDVYDSQDKNIINENANIDGQTNTAQRDFVVSEVAKKWALETYLPKDVADAHINGEIYYHDLGFAPLGSYINCCLVNVKDMLENGFTMGSANVTKPKSLRVACNIVAQIITAVSSQNYGGTTVNRIDEVLDEYVMLSYNYYKNKYANLGTFTDEQIENLAWKDTEFEAKNSFKQLEYSINCSHNSHSQVPFVTLGFGLGTTRGARLIQKSILNTRLKGLGKEGKTSIFPKLTFALKKGVNLEPNDPNYDIKQLALKCTAKRMYPDYLMYDKIVELTGAFKACMGCRSFLSTWKNDNGEEVYDGRCNMGVVSINLPRVALDTVAEYKRLRALKGKRIFDLTNDKIVLDAQEKEELRLLQQDFDWWVNFRDHETFTLFLKLLDERLELCHKALQTRIKRLETVTAKVAPICWQYGALGRLQPNDHIINLLKNGYASISLGYVGLSECISCLFGKYDGINHEYGRTRALDILKMLKDKCDKWKAEEGYGYSVYGTPAENLAGRFERLDREKYGIVKDVTDKDYYTNSFHLDVQQKVDPFAKIDYESNFLPYTSGGMINYVELPNMSHNLQALEDIINYAYNKVGYFGINSPIDVCSCGWHGESEFKDGHFICPNCGTHDPSKLHCIRRVCGYLGEVNQRPVNTGKIDEFTKRVKHV